MTAELEDRLRAHFAEVASTVAPEPAAHGPVSVVELGTHPGRRPLGVWVGIAACVLVVLGVVGGVLAGRDRDATGSVDGGVTVDGWDLSVASVEPIGEAVRITATFVNERDEVAVFRNDVTLLEPGSTPVADPAVWIGCIGDATPTRVLAGGNTVTVTNRVDEILDCGNGQIQIAPGDAVTLEVTVADVEPGSVRLWLTSIATPPFDLPPADRADLGDECATDDPNDVLLGVLERRLAGSAEQSPCAGAIDALSTADRPPCWSTCDGGREAVSVELLDVDGEGAFAASVVWRGPDGSLGVTSERFRLEPREAGWVVVDWAVPDTASVVAAGEQYVADFLNALADGRYDDAAGMRGGGAADAGLPYVGPVDGGVAEQLQRWCERDGGRCATPSSTVVRPSIDGLGAVVTATFETDDGPVRRVFTGTTTSEGYPLVTGLPPRPIDRADSSGPVGEPCSSDAVTTVSADLDGDGRRERVSLVGSEEVYELRVCGTRLEVPAVTGLTTQRWGAPDGDPVLALSDVDGDGIDEITIGVRSPPSRFQGELYVLVDGELVTTRAVSVSDSVFDACADAFGPTPMTRYSVFVRTERDGIGLVRWNAQPSSPGGASGPIRTGVTRATEWTVTPASCAFEPPLA